MKKIVKLASAAIAFALGIGLIACSNGSDGDDYNADTVITLAAPSVTAKAYPGANVLAWRAVKDAQSYAVYRRDSAGYETVLSSGQTKLYYKDSDVLVNRANYTYTVVAFNSTYGLNTNSSRTAYTRDSSTSVTLTAITAPAATSALDLAKYENGWNGTTEPTSYPDLNKPANTLSSDTVVVKPNGKYVIVQFPAKVYLNYTVTDYFGNVLQDSTASLNGADSFVNNAIRTYTFIPGAGDHTLKIVASPTKSITLLLTKFQRR